MTAGGGEEFGEVSIDEEGTAYVRCGTSAHGQGHATTFSMLVADRLGLPMTAIRYEQYDTALVARGVGTYGSRSLQLGGSAVAGAAGLVLDQGRDVAARMLETTAEDVELRDGGFGVVGVPTSVVSWTDVTRQAIGDGNPLRAEHDFTSDNETSDNETYPFGTHVSVVEVDVETGAVTVVRHVAVDDCGRIVNPLIVAGQQHGGIAQGIAQALWEEVTYDGAGNPLTSTFVDYCLPTAADLPSFEVANTVTETPHNPLGAKGIGEAATVGSTAAVQNAVVDALRHLGVRHIEMPMTPEKVLRAIQIGAAQVADLWVEPRDAFEDLPLMDEHQASEVPVA